MKKQGQGSEKPAAAETYDGEIAVIQATLNVARGAIERASNELEALKIRRERETNDQFSLL